MLSGTTNYETNEQSVTYVKKCSDREMSVRFSYLSLIVQGYSIVVT